jgi:hypothetical protein
MHAVVDALAGPVLGAARDADFQVDDAGSRGDGLELAERITRT